MFERVAAMGLEGIVSKLRDGPYRSGRSKSWLKIKRVKRETLTIVGAVAKADRVASLHLARRVGKTLVYAGQAGTGLPARDATALLRTLNKHIVDEPPLPVPSKTARDFWVEPVLSGRDRIP